MAFGSRGVGRVLLAATLTVGLVSLPSYPTGDADAAPRSKQVRAKKIDRKAERQKSARAAAEQRRKEELEQRRIEDERQAAEQRRQEEERQARAEAERREARASAEKAAKSGRATRDQTRAAARGVPAKEAAATAPAAAASKGTPIVPHDEPAERTTKSELPPPGDLEAPAWTDAEVIKALAACVEILAPLGAEVKVSQPIRDGTCGAPAPVLVRRIGSVDITPPAVVTCPMVGALHRWVTGAVDPAARDLLGSPVRRLVTMSGYSCRNRIGTANEKISQHAYANAIDIGAVVTEDGRSVDVLSGWGETSRDVRRAAQEKAVAQANAKDGKAASSGGGSTGEAPSLPMRAGAGPRDVGARETPKRTAAESVPEPRPLIDDRRTAENRAKREFLQRIHAGACRSFGTVLGPEANEAHRNHLHLDMEARRRGSFCE